jgi:hypothetical protein
MAFEPIASSTGSFGFGLVDRGTFSGGGKKAEADRK